MQSVDQSAPPYFDDFDETKNFAKILFKPVCSVQTRELTQLQTLLQQQIKRFGDNVLKQGTIVSGCHVTTHSVLPYVKLLDLDTSGNRVDVTNLTNYYARSSSNNVALVVTGIQGYESAAPDLNTIYVRYLNSGANGTTSSFSPNDTITVYDPTQPVSSVGVVAGSAGYSNTDDVYFISSLAVSNVTSGNLFSAGLYIGDRLYDGNGANVVIKGVTYDGANTIISVKPIASDLIAANTVAWDALTRDSTLVNANTGQVLHLDTIVGSGASAQVTTNSVGSITDISMITGGSNYDYVPSVVVVSTTSSGPQQAALVATAKNYVNQVTIAGSIVSPIGNGYGLTIDSGIVYSAGYFTRTDKQLVVVDKYANTPDALAVGFDSTFSIVTSDDDPTLLDNTTGEPNSNAPGADRLKVTASAVVISKDDAAANTSFLSIIQFSAGEPYKLDQQTQYNVIDQQLAQRSYEENGNFVTDPFYLTTKSTNLINEDSTVNVIVDPGTAYINGFRVSTERNYITSVSKGVSTNTALHVATSVDYGNYLIVQDLQGKPASLIGSTVNVYGIAHALPAGADLTAPAAAIGVARVRAVVAQQRGAASQYRVYLYDIVMNPGQQVANIRSVFTTNFIANVVLTNGVAVLSDSANTRAIFAGPKNALKSVSNITYTYQKTNFGVTSINSNGVFSVSVSAPEQFPTQGTLAGYSLEQMVVTPDANTVATTAYTGTWSLTSGSPVATGTGTTATADLRPGQYIRVANTTANTVARVFSISNNTSVTLAANATFTINAPLFAYYPKNTPIELLSGTVSGGTMTVQATTPLSGSANVTLAIPVSTSAATSAKTVNRDAAIRITPSTNPGGTIGPWAIGFSDVIRLKGVYLGANTTFTSQSPNITDVTNQFYIDSNHSADYLNTGYLYRKSKSNLTVSTGNRLLVLFDVLTGGTSGIRTVSSYAIDDTVSLGASVTTVNTVELPEVFGLKGDYYDVRDSYDFRPVAANTVGLTYNHAIAPINPTEPVYGSRFSDVGPIPLPQTTITADVVYYLPRTDRVVVTSNGSFNVITGTDGSTVAPVEPANSITVNTVAIPPYPSYPAALSAEMAEIADTKISNEKYAKKRLNDYTIFTTLTASQIAAQQPRGYKMKDIGQIDRRLNAVEYYLSFSLAEAQAKNRTIPSANDPDADRFKFGFFVDSFVDTSYSDIKNPQYYANIIDGRLVPRATQYVVEFKTANNEALGAGTVGIPYNSYTLVSQLTATDGPVYIPVIEAPTPPPIIVPDTGTIIVPPVPPVIVSRPQDLSDIEVVQQSMTDVYVYQENLNLDKYGRVFETKEHFVSSLPGQMSFYLNFLDNQNCIEIYQGFTSGFDITGMSPIYNTLNAQQIGREEWYQKYGPSAPWESVGYYGDYFAGKPTLSDMAKLLFTHNPANGRYYKIVITKYKRYANAAPSGVYSYRLFYPTDSTAYIHPISLPTSFDYRGKIVDINPLAFNTAVDINIASQVTYYNDQQLFTIVAVGMKPNTFHTLSIDGVDQAVNCRIPGGILGGGLLSDQTGRLELQLFYNQGLSGQSDFTSSNIVANLVASQKVFTLTSADNSSAAKSSIVAKNYTQFSSSSSGYDVMQQVGGAVGGGLLTGRQFSDFRNIQNY